jgi:hypothetical protein
VPAAAHCTTPASHCTSALCRHAPQQRTQLPVSTSQQPRHAPHHHRRQLHGQYKGRYPQVRASGQRYMCQSGRVNVNSSRHIANHHPAVSRGCPYWWSWRLMMVATWCWMQGTHSDIRVQGAAAHTRRPPRAEEPPQEGPQDPYSRKQLQEVRERLGVEVPRLAGGCSAGTHNQSLLLQQASEL